MIYIHIFLLASGIISVSSTSTYILFVCFHAFYAIFNTPYLFYHSFLLHILTMRVSLFFTPTRTPSLVPTILSICSYSSPHILLRVASPQLPFFFHSSSAIPTTHYCVHYAAKATATLTFCLYTHFIFSIPTQHTSHGYYFMHCHLTLLNRHLQSSYNLLL